MRLFLFIDFDYSGRFIIIITTKILCNDNDIGLIIVERMEDVWEAFAQEW